MISSLLNQIRRVAEGGERVSSFSHLVVSVQEAIDAEVMVFSRHRYYSIHGRYVNEEVVPGYYDPAREFLESNCQYLGDDEYIVAYNAHYVRSIFYDDLPAYILPMFSVRKSKIAHRHFIRNTNFDGWTLPVVHTVPAHIWVDMDVNTVFPSRTKNGRLIYGWSAFVPNLPMLLSFKLNDNTSDRQISPKDHYFGWEKNRVVGSK